MDPRLRAAVDASHRWYDDVFALHGLRARRVGGLWTALDPPPPWHSCVKTVDPGVPVGDVLAAMERHEHGSVADSFGDLDLASSGFTLLFTATWQLVTTAGFEFVRAGRDDADTRPTFRPNSLLDERRVG